MERKRSIKELAVRLVIQAAAILIGQLAVALILLVGLGAPPFDVLIQGVVSRLTAEYGVVHAGFCLILVFILLIFDRKKIKPGTVLYAVAAGPAAQFYLWLLGAVVTGELFLPVRVLLLSSACLILSFATALYLEAGTGASPWELIAVTVSEKWQKRKVYIRAAFDITAIFIGFLLGGTFGIGTIACVLLTGIVLPYFLSPAAQIIEKIVNACIPAKED